MRLRARGSSTAAASPAGGRMPTAVPPGVGATATPDGGGDVVSRGTGLPASIRVALSATALIWSAMPLRRISTIPGFQSGNSRARRS